MGSQKIHHLLDREVQWLPKLQVVIPSGKVLVRTRSLKKVVWHFAPVQNNHTMHLGCILGISVKPSFSKGGMEKLEAGRSTLERFYDMGRLMVSDVHLYCFN